MPNFLRLGGRRVWMWGVLVILIWFAAGSGCATRLGLSRASTSLEGPPLAEPPLFAAFQSQELVTTPEDWDARREVLKQAFSDTLYGPYPAGETARVISHRVVDENYLDGAGRLEEIEVEIGAGSGKLSFEIAVAYPKTTSAPDGYPLILAQSFCKNQASMRSDLLSVPDDDAGRDYCNGGWSAPIIRTILGKYIESPPLETILARGYAIAFIYASDIVADSGDEGFAQLEAFASNFEEGRAPEGVISVWAAAYGWGLDVLEADERIDASRTAVWGHSRHAKAVLWAMAHDARIEAGISHQSGTGGATLSRSLKGESVKQITGSFPHWFVPKFAEYGKNEVALPLDQHQLIALSAPRPLLLGNGWNDVWSDPNGAFRAALEADKAWELLGYEGLAQKDMKDQDHSRGELVFSMTSGTHGVRQDDWDAFLRFLDRFFKSAES